MNSENEKSEKPEPLILRPAHPCSKSVVMITQSENILKITIDHYDEDLRETAKGLGYIWNSPSWTRRITKFKGPAEDRLVEAAYRLLERNFIVCIPSAEYRQRIEEGDFADERTRWIAHRIKPPYAGRFAVSWGRRENFYDEAKKLPGARYCRKSIVVKKEHFEEVMDFAEMFFFELSDGARELIEEAQQERDQYIRVELKPRRQKAAKTDPKAEKVEILDELRDEN